MSEELTELLNSHQQLVSAQEREIKAQSGQIDALKQHIDLLKEVISRITGEYFEYKGSITKYLKMLKNSGADLGPIDDDFFIRQDKREEEIRSIVKDITSNK
jgi:hypothetical protein